MVGGSVFTGPIYNTHEICINVNFLNNVSKLSHRKLKFQILKLRLQTLPGMSTIKYVPCWWMWGGSIQVPFTTKNIYVYKHFLKTIY